MTVLLVIILVLLNVNRSTELKLPLITQVNRLERYYDLFNRVRCQELPEIAGRPTFIAADDFVITLPHVAGQKGDCHALNFIINTIRTRNDKDPQSITYMLLYHDPVTNKPGDVFFKRTLSSPNATGIWDSFLGIPRLTTLTIQQGDLDDDNVTRFDFNNNTFLPHNQTLWFATYVTMVRNYSSTTSKENAFFWVTLNNYTGSTPVVDPLYKETQSNITLINHHYQYMVIDIYNQLKYNFSEWTDANIAQSKIGVSTKTYNMAWSVTLQCTFQSPTPPSTILAPSNAPSDSPIIITSPPVPINTISSTPSATPNATLSTAPSITTDNNTNTNTTNSTTAPPHVLTNTTIEDGPPPPTSRIAAPIVGIFVIIVIVGCIFGCIYRSNERANKKKKEAELTAAAVNNNSENDSHNAISMIDLNTSDEEKEKDIWIADNELSDVPLDTNTNNFIGKFIDTNLTTKRAVTVIK